MPKCKLCKEPASQKFGLSYFCTFEHAVQWANRAGKKKQQSEQRKAEREEKRKHREQKEKVKTRTEWYDQLQELVNQWVLIRDANEGCITCGTRNNVKFDAGHYMTRKAKPELRFELTQIHKQCSVQCNQHGSGMRKEYREALIAKYGEEHVAWLEGPHPTLKSQFPDVSDIKSEIAHCRKTIRGAGHKPRV